MMKRLRTLMGFVLKMMGFVLKMMGFLLKMMGFVLKMMGFLLKMMGFLLKKTHSRVGSGGCQAHRTGDAPGSPSR